MSSLFNKGLKWIVRDGGREWEFNSWEEAQGHMSKLQLEAYRKIRERNV